MVNPFCSSFVPIASSSSPRLAPDLEQARPATSGEEELQLQLALAMSREESEKVPLTELIHTHIQHQAFILIAHLLDRKRLLSSPVADMLFGNSVLNH